MRIFWCCALSVYASIFFNTVVLCHRYFILRPYGIYNYDVSKINITLAFVCMGLLCGLILAICSYLSSILEELKIKELPSEEAKKLRREHNKNKQKTQIKYIKISVYTSIIIGLIISSQYWMLVYYAERVHYLVLYKLLALISASIEVALISKSIETWLKFFRKRA